MCRKKCQLLNDADFDAFPTLVVFLVDYLSNKRKIDAQQCYDSRPVRILILDAASLLAAKIRILTRPVEPEPPKKPPALNGQRL